jgi:uncharacterized protein YdeI (BOF family)
MLKKFLASILVLLSGGAFALAPGFSKNNYNQKQSATTIKRKISKFGVDASVIVKLDDGRKLRGRIVEIEDDRFVLRTEVKGDRITIAYSQIKQVKYDGSDGGANLLPGFLIAGGVILLIKLIH